MTKAPAFQLDAELYLSSSAVQCMSLAEEGAMWRELVALGEAGDRDAVLDHDFIVGFTRRIHYGRREPISSEVRRMVLFVGLCAYCSSSEYLEVDHIIPVCAGGKSDISNLQALCRTCNRKKGGRIG